jgi:cell division initiation protein
MRITPLDLRNHRFRGRLSGYDREEVDAFLGMVADDYEELVRERELLREQVVKLEARVHELAANETLLQDTLTTAQKLSEDLKQTALKESEVTIGEAEVRAEKILDAAHRRAAQLAHDIREMRSLRSRLAAGVRAAIDTHLRLLEGLAEDPPGEPALEETLARLTRGLRSPRPGEEA